MTNAKELLKKVPRVFQNENVRVATPSKIRDAYGHQYLIPGAKRKILAAVHVENYFERHKEANLPGAKMELSTNEKLGLGDLVFCNDDVFAIEGLKSTNEPSNAYHYYCSYATLFYDAMILTAEQQEEQIIGVNCTRFLLEFAKENKINLTPSQFLNNKSSFFSFDVVETYAHSPAYFDYKNAQILQNKYDEVDFFAVNKSAQEILEFQELMQKHAQGFSVGDFMSFKAVNHYNKALDLRANIQEARVKINYNVIGIKKARTRKLIKSCLVNIKQTLLRSEI